MENIWAILKRKVVKMNPKTVEELIENIHNECIDFPYSTVLNTLTLSIIELTC